MERKKNKKEKLFDLTSGNTTKEISISSGKTPPNSVDIEKLILGAVLIDNKAIERVLKRFGAKPEIFYDKKHELIYESICYLNSKNLPIDMATVIQELKRNEKLNEAGGDDYIIDLSMGVSSTSHLDYHLMVVLEKYLARVLVNICGNTIDRVYREGDDFFETLESHQNGINLIEEIIAQQQDTASSLELHRQLLEQQKNKVIPGVACKHRSVESKLRGWRNSDLIIIGGRPGMGKTTFVLDDVFHISKRGIAVAFFSLEMSAIQLHSKMVSNETEISGNAFRDMSLSDMEMQKLYETNIFDDLPFYIEDKTFELNKILAKARLLVKEKNVEIIVIDYLQLIDLAYSNGMNDNSKVSFISRKLKLLAKELDIPVIVLSQLSRKVEDRPSKRPQISDLRDSGAIEQDADIVAFMFRPEYYKIDTWDNDLDGEQTSTKNEAEFICAKFRGGSIFESRLKFRGDYSKFFDTNTDFGGYENPVPRGSTSNAFGDDKFEY